MRRATAAIAALALAGCRYQQPLQPALQVPVRPDLAYPEYLGEDTDNLGIPSADWLLGPWVVDVDSIDPEESDLTPEFVTRLHRSVLVIGEASFRYQDFVGPEFTIHAEGSLVLGAVDEAGEVALTFQVVGQEPHTDVASRFGLTLFLAPPFAWHAWHRPSSGPDWIPEREAHLAELLADLVQD